MEEMEKYTQRFYIFVALVWLVVVGTLFYLNWLNML